MSVSFVFVAAICRWLLSEISAVFRLAVLLQLAFVGCAIIGAIVIYKVFQGNSVEGAIRDTKGTIKGGYKDAKGSVKVSQP